MNFIQQFFGSDKTGPDKINFEDVQHAIQYSNEYLIINTLPLTEQDILIQGTIRGFQEEHIINEMLTKSNVPDKKVVLYGKHANDETTLKKYKQLISLGIADVFIYSGGLFEWLLLQDIYGEKSFPTTKKTLDLLKYRPERTII